jgi:hypothetical protein
MMQTRNHSHDGEDEPSAKWYEISASVGHLVLAVLLAIIGGGSVVFSYLWDSHKSITLLQERQAVVMKYITDDVTATAERERQLARTLGEIAHSIEELKIEVVRHMAASQAQTDFANDNAGIKRRQ